MYKLIVENLKSSHQFIKDDTCHSYRDLDDAVSRLNRYIMENNIHKIMICLPQCFFTYAAIIASYISNTTFCCVNDMEPIVRKQQFISEFLPDAVCGMTYEMAGIDNIKVISEEDLRVFSRSEGEFSHWDVERDSIAYVYYTSGSTGRPKGVKIYRRSLEKVILWYVANFSLTNRDVLSQYPNINFDMSLEDIFGAVTAGASLVPFSTLSDKMFPAKKILQHSITFWNSVPTVIDILKSRNKLTKEVFCSVKKLKFGGEQIFPNKVAEVIEILPEAELFLTYGPTEITMLCTCLPVNRLNYSDYAKDNMSLGLTIPGWNLLLHDPVDEIGEIVVYGDYIGAGYLGNNSGFGVVTVDGVQHNAYFTGDYGTYKDGNLYFVGRSDSQVKINGNRVDLTEVDKTLRSKGCAASFTLMHEKKIWTFFISDTLSELQAREILKDCLPICFIPHYMVRKTDFPLNSSDKIDRAKLVLELQDILRGVEDD